MRKPFRVTSRVAPTSATTASHMLPSPAIAKAPGRSGAPIRSKGPPMTVQFVPLARQLIALRSDPGPAHASAREAALALLADRLSDFTVEWFERNGQRSFLAYVGPVRPAVFRVIFNGHVDVIPGNEQFYQPWQDGDRLYGIGALDMKANLVVMCEVFRTMATQVPVPIALQVVSDEETGGFDGTLLQIEQGVRADLVISGETTQFQVVNQAKGIVWLKVHATGEAAHGAYPWRGQNAILTLSAALQRVLQRYPTPADQAWVTTVNVARIETTNQAFNRVPDQATAWLDIRCIPADAPTVVATVQEAVGAHCQVELVVAEPALATSAAHPDVQALQQAVAAVRGSLAPLAAAQGSSDARHYMRVGGAGVEFGPIGGGIASDTEWTSMAGLAEYAQVLSHFLRTLR